MTNREIRIKALIAIEETALLYSHNTDGAERIRHKERAQAAYDERIDLLFATKDSEVSYHLGQTA